MNKNIFLQLALLLFLAFACSPRANKMNAAEQAINLTSQSPVIILDGIRLPSNQSLAHLSPDDVEAVEVIAYSKENKKYLKRAYGPAAKEGVVKITTKQSAIVKQEALHAALLEKINAFERDPFAYLFVMDGILVATNEISKLKALSPSDLTVVEVLKFKTAKVIYGDEARENTVIINTRSMHLK